MAMRHPDLMRRYTVLTNPTINGDAAVVVDATRGDDSSAVTTPASGVSVELGVGEYPPAYSDSRDEEAVVNGRSLTLHNVSRSDAPPPKPLDQKGGVPSRSMTPLADGEWMAFDRAGIRTSNVHVIDDDPSQFPPPCAANSSNITATLFRCRRLILRPYLFLLRLIAWQPFSYRFQNT